MDVKSLVSCTWLLEQLENKNEDIVILETTWMPKGKSKESYIKEHIPNARFFDMWEGVRPKRTFARPLPNMNVFRKQLERLGVSTNSHVILYDLGDIKFAARMWIQCRELGLRRVSVLEGGLRYWKTNEYPIESGNATELQDNEQEGSLQTTTMRPSLCCELDDMHEIISSRTRQIVDSRAPKHFSGNCQEPSPSTLKAFKEAQMDPPMILERGHMTGAKNIHYETLLDAQTSCFKTESQLRQIFGDAGVHTELPSVSSCYTGQTACLVPLALSKLGVDVDDHYVYLGSWTEFGQLGSPKDIESDDITNVQKPIISQMNQMVTIET